MAEEDLVAEASTVVEVSAVSTAVAFVVAAAVATYASALRGSKVEFRALLQEARASQAELAASLAIVARCL